jgi:hypothetical protein
MGETMRRLNYGLLLLGLALGAVAITGCPGAPEREVLDTEYVEGVVTLDGEPVAEATVTFIPVTDGQGCSATGRTDASGTYKLTAVPTGELTAEPGAGTLPGEYYVGVRKIEMAAGGEEEEEEEEELGEPGENEPTYLVPKKYDIPTESGIQVTVKEGENDIPIELSSQ